MKISLANPLSDASDNWHEAKHAGASSARGGGNNVCIARVVTEVSNRQLGKVFFAVNLSDGIRRLFWVAPVPNIHDVGDCSQRSVYEHMSFQRDIGMLVDR